MSGINFDDIARLFAQRKLSRRQALAQGAVGLTAGIAVSSAALGHAGSAASTAADDLASSSAPATEDGFMVLSQSTPGATTGATAVATPAGSGPSKPITFLFVQSFETGSLVAKEGSPGRYTLTLNDGLGDTIYFSDRPDKIVGTVPTDQFLTGLGFPPNNPPNAALIGLRDADHKDVVVLELFAPEYDAASNILTYDVAVLEDWRKLNETFQQTPDDEAHLPRDFTAAHLFIDDCPDGNVTCWKNAGYYEGDDYIGDLGRRGLCYQWQGVQCLPCAGDVPTRDECNARFPACSGQCVIHVSYIF